jgi:uroporphyrinogen decarboxylase
VVASGTPISWEYSIAPEQESAATYQRGSIQVLADIETYPWPDPVTVEVAHIERATALAPPGLGIIAGVGGVFTRTWMIMGYEHFSMSLIDDPDLVVRVAERVGRIQCAVMRRLIKLPGIVAVWYGDDLAYTESLLTSPKVLRRHFFPWIEELAGIAHGAGMPFIMHSDGRL